MDYDESYPFCLMFLSQEKHVKIDELKPRLKLKYTHTQMHYRIHMHTLILQLELKNDILASLIF